MKEFSWIPGSGKWKTLSKNKNRIVKIPKIIVVPILKKVDDTIAGIINNIEKGLDIPPVKYNNKLSWNKS